MRPLAKTLWELDKSGSYKFGGMKLGGLIHLDAVCTLCVYGAMGAKTLWEPDLSGDGSFNKHHRPINRAPTNSAG